MASNLTNQSRNVLSKKLMVKEEVISDESIAHELLQMGIELIVLLV